MRLNSKEQNLVLENLNLVHYFVKRLTTIPYAEYEDMLSIGKIGLIKAALTFDTSKKMAFSTYASRCILNELYSYLKKEKSHFYDISLDAPIDTDMEGQITLLEKISDPNGDFSKKVEESELFIELINIILNTLNPKQKLVMLYSIAGVRQQSIANTLQISRSYVARLKQQAVKKIRSYFISKKQFKKVFSMEIVNVDFYKLDILHTTFTTFLQNIACRKNVRVNYCKERTSILLPAEPNSFCLIAAQIIEEEIESF